MLLACLLASISPPATVQAEGETPSSTSLPEESSVVTVEANAFYNATSYTISDGDCTISWIAYGSELNKGVVKQSASCSAPLADQLPLLRKISEKFYTTDRFASAFHTLFWGGLVAERKPDSYEMPARLALAAHRSADWDTEKGRPKNGDLNGFIKNLAIRESIYQELKVLFEHFHRNIELSSVEKVRVIKAEKLPFYDKLMELGIKPSEKLPFDCMAWFSVSAVAKGDNKF